MNSGNVVQPNGKKPEVKNARWWSQTLNTYVSACTQDSNEIPTAIAMFSRPDNTNGAITVRHQGALSISGLVVAIFNCRLPVP